MRGDCEDKSPASLPSIRRPVWVASSADLPYTSAPRGLYRLFTAIACISAHSTDVMPCQVPPIAFSNGIRVALVALQAFASTLGRLRTSPFSTHP